MVRGDSLWSDGSRPSRGGTVIDHEVAVRVNGGFLILDNGAVLARPVRDDHAGVRGDLRGGTKVNRYGHLSGLIRGSELTTKQGANTANQHSKRGSNLSGDNHTNLAKDPDQHHGGGTSKTSTSRGTDSS